MGSGLKNFKTVVYIPAMIAASFSPEKLASDYEFIEEFIGLDKVYLETHRNDCDVDPEQIKMIKSFLESKGVEVSGGITTTIGDPRNVGHEVPQNLNTTRYLNREMKKQRLFGTFCYTDPVMRERLKEISENTARLFDEIILDDFYFTNCTCEDCIRAKGDRDWVTFRRELMKEVSENLIVKPAKAVNPDVKVIIKYPNWRESYHFTGYVPEVQRDIFDATYTGTETRSPGYTDQHLPEYLSYSLVRYMDNAWPGRNGGGWFDTYQCWSVDRYLEQAYLTAFAKAHELMHFQWSDLIDNPFVTAMKLQIGKIDRMIDTTGVPTGVPVYIPFASDGENHLEMRLGMLGIPADPTPFFPENARTVLFTKSSLADRDVISKIESFVRAGGNAVITSGFLKEAGDELLKSGLTECRLTGRSFKADRYHVTGDMKGYYEHEESVLFPELTHGNNASWSLLNAGSGDLHASVVLRSSYGSGRLYTIVIPEHETDLYKLPDEVIDVYRRVLLGSDYYSGSGFSAFTYDDGSMILYRYVKGDLHPACVTLHTGKEVSVLVDMTTGEKIPVIPRKVREDFEETYEYTADVILVPGIFRKYKWE